MHSFHVFSLFVIVHNFYIFIVQDVISYRDEEKERLKIELKAARDQIAMYHGAQPRSPSNSFSRTSRPNSFISVTSSEADVAEVTEDITHVVSSSDESGKRIYSYTVLPSYNTSGYNMVSCLIQSVLLPFLLIYVIMSSFRTRFLLEVHFL